MQTLKQQIEQTMFQNPGKIYIASDFLELGDKNNIKLILHRLNKEGKIERLINGLYVKPYYSNILKRYSYPRPEEVAQKIAQKNGWTIAPAKNATLNYTGVSTQVPAVFEYISNGLSKEYYYRVWKITFIRRPKKYISSHSLKFIILIEAIRTLGKKYINNSEIRDLAYYAQNIREDLLLDTMNLDFWIRNVLLKIKEINDNR
ncbi:Uncharacterised protein [Mycoplasmopsis citelli]|uniref:Transcriptional regulator, AbiEi antitoxin, Type IV TA system n=1 Tax=Mycoplasmopsis citelli TaxID=171281 RepID=A0A449B3F6_9BACT|nr:DUF6088 family protein [Mycoplasmopsis citelli]VEU75074.1 Uncharacterised protein [Mycoplasmopsis citelli]